MEVKNVVNPKNELEQQVMEVGQKLLQPPHLVHELLLLLNQAEKVLSQVEQTPTSLMLYALKPSMKALIHDDLLKHSDVDVKVAVASCLTEILRITAPNPPYDDDPMKAAFLLIVSTFADLADRSSLSYIKRTLILEAVCKVRSCVIMLDLECEALIVEMFEHFLRSIRDYHRGHIFSNMQNIMVMILEESDEISVELLKPLLASVKRHNAGVLPVARMLGETVLWKSAEKIRPYLRQAVTVLGDPLDAYTEIVATVCGWTTATFQGDDENASRLSYRFIHISISESY